MLPRSTRNERIQHQHVENHDASHVNLVRPRNNTRNRPVETFNNQIDNDAVWKQVLPCGEQEKLVRTATSRNTIGQTSKEQTCTACNRIIRRCELARGKPGSTTRSGAHRCCGDCNSSSVELSTPFSLDINHVGVDTRVNVDKLTVENWVGETEKQPICEATSVTCTPLDVRKSDEFGWMVVTSDNMCFPSKKPCWNLRKEVSMNTLDSLLMFPRWDNTSATQLVRMGVNRGVSNEELQPQQHHSAPPRAYKITHEPLHMLDTVGKLLL